MGLVYIHFSSSISRYHFYNCTFSAAAAAACSCFYHSDASTFGFVPDRRSTFDPFVNPITPEEAQRLHLINAYRRYGYLKANLDPLKLAKASNIRELNPELYGLKLNDKNANGVSVEQLVGQLEALYCGPIAVEFMHLNVGFFSIIFGNDTGNPNRNVDVFFMNFGLKSFLLYPGFPFWIKF